MAITTVDAYIESLPTEQAKIVSALRKVILKAAPEATESFKWAQPVYESGGPFCYIKAFKSSVNFGFWRGVDLDDPDGRLEGSGHKMRHVKIEELSQIEEKAFAAYVKQAVQLNAAMGDPSRNK
jgi:hypothetical protein